ncbi:alpha/beta hydrolase [Mycolicibacterium flavescens]|uniref:AB hydrolase-1 domain-containing protein n=1 Tax=Mycolicibacterium flavescens TaxID=1776 RepID=A0A1E3RMQ0_MYCFV|nr:alpha/beta hydrolase [Mycolicibacterium flavescens]MCV7281360.1 alpha/beta hydrolase [Mycolicibacterium flavescens]ODQ91134.1 hypothetical protein BHQ18_06980 [Mycolicibacterium flavescens]
MGLSSFRSARARDAYVARYDESLSASSVPITESDVPTSFGRTHVLTAGDRSKPPLVALHGSSSSATAWVPNLPVLTATHCVTMVDAIDEVGKSVASRPTTKSADLVRWLDDVLCACEIQRSAFIGASRGAWIATHYASAHPERVERLALLSPVGIACGTSPRFLIHGLTTIGVWPTERRVWSMLESLVTPATRSALRQPPWRMLNDQFVAGALYFKTSMSNPQPRPWPLHSDCDLRPIASARIPVLVVIGEQETANDGPKSAARLRRQLPQARIEFVADAGHGLAQDRPEVVDKLLGEFLS